MKKILLPTMLAVALFANPANNGGAGGFQGAQGGAQDGAQGNMQGMGGWSGPRSGGVNTVAGALNAWDDTHVMLTGKIIRQVAHEKYEFSDGKNSIIIDIDDDEWYGQTIGPNDTIQIYGEVDAEPFRRNQIDVDSFRKVN